MENNNYTEITKIVEAYLNGEGTEPDIEVLYEYAVAAKNGEIEETQENIDRILRKVFRSAINSGDFHGVFDKLPLWFPEDVVDYWYECDIVMVSYLADYCLEERDDEENFFRFSKIGAEIHPYGGSGVPFLLEFLSCRDSCMLNLARCYKDGIGTEKDYPEAFYYYMSYHTDPLMVKGVTDDLDDSELADLYWKLKDDADAGKNYPGLYYALAVMSKEGIGTSYNIKKYNEYAQKEMENNRCRTKKELKYYHLIVDYARAHIGDTIYPVVKDIHAADLKRGDVVRFGRYNHREILWYVVEIEDGAALLLSTDCLESTYIANRRWLFEGPSGEDFLHSKIRRFTSEMAYFIFKNDYTEGLIPDKNGDYVFLLGVDEIKRYKLLDRRLHSHKQPRFRVRNELQGRALQRRIIRRDDRRHGKNERRARKMLLAGARAQAVINGYGNSGVEIDPETGTAPWWTSTDGEAPGSLVFLDTDGEFYEQNMKGEQPGIRPAIRVKLN